MKKYKVCHFTSVHPAEDVRIFHKQCKSLAAAGWEVHYVAKDCLQTESENIFFHPLPPFFGNRLKRIVLRAYQAYKIASAINADIYHFHDPELLPWGLLLKWRGKKVIYDAHEDVPQDILTKHWIPKYLRTAIANIFEKFENFTACRIDCVVTATPYICQRFLRIGAKEALDINNYPHLNEFDSPTLSDTRNQSKTICYTGLISNERGVKEILHALNHTNNQITLTLAGSFITPSLRSEISLFPTWGNIIEHGHVDRKKLSDIFQNSIAGLVLFHPLTNHTNAQPNKLFEYMAAGLPVIASNFPLWRNIIEKYQCGLCVDPLNPIAIASAIDWIIQHPQEAQTMGENGREAIRNHFNWDSEAKKLNHLYLNLI